MMLERKDTLVKEEIFHPFYSVVDFRVEGRVALCYHVALVWKIEP